MNSDRPTDPVPHLSAAEFRERGRQMIDFIAAYWERLQATPASAEESPALPVLSRVQPGDVLARLPEAPPEHPEAWEDVMRDVESIILPGLTHWQSPSFFAYFSTNCSAPALLGDLLASGLSVNGMLWATSPAATELETRMLDWMGEMIGLPESFRSTSSNGGGVIQGTASEATLIALLAARRRAIQRRGDAAGRLVVYASTQAHSSVVKGAMIAGIAAGPEDRGRVRLIETDGSYAMRADELSRWMESDAAAGLIPAYVCATVGTTSSGAIDPVPAIVPLCRRHGAWLHVDAAWAGAACVCPEHRDLLAGAEGADSICFNPHKWLLTNFDCDLLWTQDRASLVGALSITPEYLRNAASDAGSVIDYRDWQIPLGRRFRALKLWFVIRHYGVHGLRAHIREHVRLGELFESLVRSDPRFEVAAPRSLSLVCFRFVGADAGRLDECNRSILRTINDSGHAHLTHTVLPGVDGGAPRLVLRLAIGSTRTREPHVRAAWDLARRAADRVSSSS